MKQAKIVIQIDRELRKRFKILCTEQDTTVKEKLTKFIKEEIKKHENKGKD